MISEIKVWQLTPEQVANYRPGMYLGKPHRTEQPETLVKPGDRNPPIPRKREQKGRPPRKEVITKYQYRRMRAKGFYDVAIAAAFDISPSTLRNRKREWGLM